MEHNSTTGRGGESNTGPIPIHHIRFGYGNDIGSGNVADDDDYSIILSSSSSYWGRTTKKMREDILQCRVVCVNSKRVPEGSRGRNICHKNATKAISQNFGGAKQFVPNRIHDILWNKSSILLDYIKLSTQLNQFQNFVSSLIHERTLKTVLL